MSVGNNLQEMENVVTKGAAPAEPMQAAGVPVEDLGGPTPENSRPDDGSNALKTPGATLKQVKDVVNSKAVAAMEETEVEEETISEEEVEEVTAETEVAEESEEDGEVVAEEEEVEVKYDMEEDVQALLSGEELSEEFQEKARTIFESAINAKAAEIQEELTAAYETALVEEVTEIRDTLTERLDSYLEYVADEWIAENALQIEQGLKTEMTESFLAGMRGLFEEHYVSIPEEKYDVVSTMVEKLDEMENKLNEQIERNIALNNRLAESVADVIFADVAEGLAISQKDKLASLAENVEFDSEDTYREKLVALKESYFPTNTSAQRDESETISEDTDVQETLSESVSPRMAAYLDTLGRVAKK
jgi:hypothetical protein